MFFNTMLSAEEITEQLNDVLCVEVVIYYYPDEFETTIYYDKLDDKYYVKRLDDTPEEQEELYLVAELCNDNVRHVFRHNAYFVFEIDVEIDYAAIVIWDGNDLYDCMKHLYDNNWTHSIINNWFKCK